MSATTPALLSLGSNLDPETHLRAAFDALRVRFGHVVASPVYRVPAVGFDGPDFLNAAAVVDSDLDPFALADWLHALEAAQGRRRGSVAFCDRTLDVDLVYFGDRVLDGPRLRLPRPDARQAFVLRPLADIAPAFVDPVRGATLAALWAAHPEHDAHFETVSL